MHEPNEGLNKSTHGSEGAAGADKPARGGEDRKPIRKRRIEPPVLVIEPQKEPEPPIRPDAASARNLEEMVQDLLNRVREAEERLQEKEEAISLLQDQTVTMARKLLLPGKGTPGSPAALPGTSLDPLDLEDLDFFTRASQSAAPAPPLPAAAPTSGKQLRLVKEPKSGRSRSPAAAAQAHVGPAVPGGRPCPACGKHLRKARCLNVQIQVCLACRGLFLDARGVRQLARHLPWMQYVQKFLSSAARGAPIAAKPAKGSSPQKSGGSRA